MKAPTINRQIYDAPYVYPIKAIQIGEGNFIRAFIDWMVEQCNQQGVFQGTIAATQPRAQGAPKLQKLKEQDGLFTVIVRGLVNGTATEEFHVVSSIAETIEPYSEWESFIALADDPNIEFIFSNTTEAGITYSPEEGNFDKPIQSYPGKLAALLYRRYQNVRKSNKFKGMLIIPCELVERGGDDLRKIVLQHADDWNLGEDFKSWVEKENIFLNSIVDRIVTGYPNGEIEQLEELLQYQDSLITVAEPYYQWIIEGNEEVAARLPFHQAGLNVDWVDDLIPYIKRKVRILNGAHTFMVPIAYLQGYDIVRDAMNDPIIAREVQYFLTDKVIPILPFSQEELEEYVDQTFDRFRNPYINHQLLDIALNSTSKFCTRLLPTLLESINNREIIPYDIVKSLAYLIRFYRCEQDEDGRWLGWRIKSGSTEVYQLKDSDQVLTSFCHYWANYDQDHDIHNLVRNILSSSKIWPTPLSTCSIDSFEQICKHTSQELSSLLEKEERSNIS